MTSRARGVICAIACAAAPYLAVALLVFAQDNAQPSAAVAEAARLIAIFEKAERGELDGAPPADEDLDAATRALQDHLAANPDDVDGLIVFARLGRFSTVAEPVVIGPGEQLPAPEAQSAAEVAALEHALEIEPDNAEAHYWLARIFGLTVPKVVDDVFRPGPLDLDQAIAHALRAAELGPGEMRYREAAAIYLAQAQRFDDALNLFAPNDPHAIRRILGDLAAVPLPPEARYLPDEAARWAQTMPWGGIDDYLLLRVRFFIAPGGRGVFETPLKQRWPEFEFYEASRGDGAPMWTQVLEVRDGALRPMDPKELAVEVRNDEQPAGGVGMSAFEITDPSPETRELLGVATGDRFTMLVLFDVTQ